MVLSVSPALPGLVGGDLLVIGQSSPWQPDVDLLALDCEGDLWFFELKAVPSSSENLLQVLRYSQSYSELSIDGLSTIYERYTRNSTRSLAVGFCEYFGYSSPSAVHEWSERIGRRHHLLVVTDGANDETIAAVNHWQHHGLDIDIWPYRVHAGDEKSFRLELPELYVRGRRISNSDPGIFLVNSNRSHDPLTEPYMLDHGVALATEPKWMRKINRITANSRVLLYGNGIGILALGIATPERRDGVLGSTPMRFVKLREFKKLKTVMAPSEIKKAGAKDYVFRHTVLELSGAEGEKVWNAAVARIEPNHRPHVRCPFQRLARARAEDLRLYLLPQGGEGGGRFHGRAVVVGGGRHVCWRRMASPSPGGRRATGWRHRSSLSDTRRSRLSMVRIWPGTGTTLPAAIRKRLSGPHANGVHAPLRHRNPPRPEPPRRVGDPTPEPA